MSTLNFKNAASDFRFLKNRQYPEKAALKLIGDRYRLSACCGASSLPSGSGPGA
jgi:hypothetical protein